MPRQRSTDSIEAEELYHSGMSLADIARKLGKPEGTVRRWKSTQKWDTEQKSERSERKANARKENRTIEEKAVEEDVRQVLENPELTDRQRLFCLHYVKCFNATKAYKKAYGCDEYTARANGSRLLTVAKVRDEIHSLKQERFNREMLNESDIFQKYMDIAFADITDFMEFGNEKIKVVGKNGEEHEMKVSNVNIKNDREVDGTLISEVSKGRDGVKVKLADRMKALEWMTEHMNMATEEQKIRIEQMRSKINEDKDRPIQITFTKASDTNGKI